MPGRAGSSSPEKPVAPGAFQTPQRRAVLLMDITFLSNMVRLQQLSSMSNRIRSLFVQLYHLIFVFVLCAAAPGRAPRPYAFASCSLLLLGEFASPATRIRFGGNIMLFHSV